MDRSDPENNKNSDKPGRRITINDVAATLGVSKASVSLALRDHPRVSEALRNRIQEKAKEMGYAPDPRMQALSRYSRVNQDDHHPPVLGWLNIWEDPAEMQTFKELALYYKASFEAAGPLGFRMEEIVACGRSMEDVVSELRDRNIRGFIYQPTTHPVLDMTRFPVSDFTIVRFGLETEKPYLHSVTADQVSNGIMAYEKVRERGYERIGFVTLNDQKLPFGAGVFWAQKEQPSSRRVPMLLLPKSDFSRHGKQLSAWIKREKPDALITNLAHLPRLLLDLGLRIPADIAIATTSIYDTPIAAGIDQHPEEIGRVALLTLVSLMNEAELEKNPIQNQGLIEGSWVDGDSLPSRVPGQSRSEPQVPRPYRNEVTPARKKAAPRQRVTVRALAKVLGVSHVTVSLALRNHPRISEAVRIRIQKKAAEMGYVPDPMLAAMQHRCRAQSPRTIQAELAWFNVWDNPKKLYSYREFELYRNGAAESAQQHGFQLEEYMVKDFPLPRLDRILKTRNVRGILVPPIALPLPVDLRSFPWADFVEVRFGTNHEVPTHYSVSSDQEANGELAFKRAWELGYRRIGFVGDHAVQRIFGAGFFWARRELPEERQLPMFFLPLANPVQHRKKLAAWILREKPDAIITDNDTLPQMLTDLGVRIPDDIALATTSVLDTPINAGIDQHAEEIGRMAVVSLISHLNDSRLDEQAINSQIRVKGDWVDGDMMPSRA